jgi:hypothetical protein
LGNRTSPALHPRSAVLTNLSASRSASQLLLEYDNSRLDDYIHRADPEKGRTAAINMSTQLGRIESELLRCITPHTTDKNLAKLRGVTAYFSDAANLERIIVHPQCADDLAEIVDTVRGLLT